ncbi:enterochelin esterase [Nocardiopsis alba]|uniref:Esterase family protein n=1 Tax=Nocardiopsis alba (strain ATCC BAA-2165 / BE74) TaxID=1205910 RepID=J7L9Q4_NOCAA|nr:enterochelin esterase [Nocardiopsis alba]AFR07202.1 esterase family protein [Nocardiopsis alba ATCC BAA-2165]
MRCEPDPHDRPAPSQARHPSSARRLAAHHRPRTGRRRGGHGHRGLLGTGRTDRHTDRRRTRRPGPTHRHLPLARRRRARRRHPHRRPDRRRRLLRAQPHGADPRHPADGTPAPENALSATTRTRRERALALSDPEDRPAVARWFDALAHARPDPRAREALDAHHSVVSLPEAPPRLRHDPDAPRGTLTRRTLASERLGNTRDVWIHRPAREPVDGTWTVAILLDGRTWHDLPLAPLLDGLIADGTLPPMLTVMVDSLDQATRTRELACHDLFVDFLDTELLPWLGELHPVTDDPGRTLIAGQSLGGLTALYAALRRPGRFGRVLSQSGSYWWPNPAVTGGETERTVRLVREADALPERVHLSAGLHEWALLGANGRVHEALLERGRELGLPGDFAGFTEYNGGHDKACWRADLPHGLIALTEDHAR